MLKKIINMMKNFKSLFKMRYFVALFSLFIIIGRTIWPNFKYDGTSFNLTLLAAIVLLIPDIGGLLSRIKKFKKGDLEIELESQINDLAGKTEKAEEDEDIENNFEFEHLSEGVKNRIAEYTRDPKGGLVAVAVEIESRANELAKRFQISSRPRYLSPIKIVDELTNKGIIPKVLPALMRDFWAIRNKAVHDSEFRLTNEHLYRLLDLGIRILDLLYFTNPNVYDPAKIDKVLDVYHAIKRFIAQITVDGTTTNENLNKLLQETKNVNVIFKDNTISKYIDLLYKKGIDLQFIENETDRTRDKKKLEELLEKRSQLFSWFPRQHNFVDNMFKPYLNE